MRRVLPFPVLWALLVGMWLLLVETLDPAHVVLGALVAGVAVRLLAPLLEPAPVRRPLAFLELSALVLADVVRSNVAVARIVLRGGGSTRTTGFVDIPLALRSPVALAALACIVTSTPGTAWAGYDARRGVLTLHVFDLVDEAGWIRTIKGRYERLLMEVFE